MDWLKTWVTTIITLSIFTAVANSMLPNGTIKKYAKYAISILIIPTLLAPILLLIDGNNVAAKIENYSSKLNLNTQDIDLTKFNSAEESTILKVFLKNLNNQCEELLENRYPTKEIKVETFGNITKEKKISIESIIIYIEDKNLVKEIKEVSVDIDKESSKKESNIQEKENIITLISQELKVSPLKITIRSMKEG